MSLDAYVASTEFLPDAARGASAAPPRPDAHELLDAFEHHGSAHERRLRRREMESGLRDTLEELRRTPEMGIRARAEVRLASEHVRDHRLDLIDARDLGQLRAELTLTDDALHDVVARIEGGAVHADGIKMRFDGMKRRRTLAFARGWRVQRGDVEIRISDGRALRGTDTVRCARGMVEIIVRKRDGKDEDLARELIGALRDELGIETGTEPESALQRSEYARHHKIPEEAVPQDALERLQRVEALPGYTALVEQGKRVEYEALSPYAVYHEIGFATAQKYLVAQKLVQMLKTGGLLATKERFRRGVFSIGGSPMQDLRSGAADSVFTRVMTQKGLENRRGPASDQPLGVSPSIIFDPAILERTDWYAYPEDSYGATDDATFAGRQSPEELFDQQGRDGFSNGNEQMFRCGIGAQAFRAIACGTVEDALIFAKTMRKEGVTEIAGRPVDEVIMVAREGKDFIAISSGTPVPSVRTLAQLAADDPTVRAELERPLAARSFGERILQGIETFEEIFNKLSK